MYGLRAARTLWSRSASYLQTCPQPTIRSFASVAADVPPITSRSRDHKVVVVGAGAAGLSIAHQLLRSGEFRKDDIAIVDPAAWHDFQPGWTLVGGGVKDKQDLRKPMGTLIDPKIRHYQQAVNSFSPDQNSLSLDSGGTLNYEQLVVVPGITLYLDQIKGLREALANPEAPVATNYDFEYTDKVWRYIDAMRRGEALFTQPAGIVKCAGAPQKIMWLGLDHWKRTGRYSASQDSNIKISFATSLPRMFGVDKYSARLEQLRKERGVEGLFQHDLVAVDGNKATFALPEGKEQVTRRFDFLHAVPKMGPHDFIKRSPLANEAGLVDVNIKTTRHNQYPNVWSAGDASSLPTSKTAAAITAQAPVLVENLLAAMKSQQCGAMYNGYTSCPIPVSYGKLMLAEFKYDGVPEETFGRFVDQGTPRRAFYHMKKTFFPWVYFNSMLKGTWAGPKGWKM